MNVLLGVQVTRSTGLQVFFSKHVFRYALMRRYTGKLKNKPVYMCLGKQENM